MRKCWPEVWTLLISIRLYYAVTIALRCVFLIALEYNATYMSARQTGIKIVSLIFDLVCILVMMGYGIMLIQQD